MSNSTLFALKGDVVDCGPDGALRVWPGHYLVCLNGRCAGVFPALPARFAHACVEDYNGKLILPGLCDLHTHAPQYTFRGLAMDLELLDWLAQHTFPEESRYADLAYAEKAYNIFAHDLAQSATTRAAVFATLHRPATLLLMRKLEATGLACLVGKVNMDRNSPDFYCEKSPEDGLADTRLWLEDCSAFANTKPILTPRFTPSVSDAYMEGLGRLAQESALPVQSHLSENLSEIDWVRQLCPGTTCYAQSYNRFGLLGPHTVLAHCVWSGPEEVSVLKSKGVYIAHCPASNANVRSGIAPAKQYLDAGLNIGLGSDIAAGESLNLFAAIAEAVKVSKLRWRLVDETIPALTLPEAFYLATRGGGSFFGKVGAFDDGYDFDAIVMDDSPYPTVMDCTLAQRLERLCYLTDGKPTAKFCQGRKII